MPDFVDTMAYVGQTPWHGLGKYVGDQEVDSKTMIEAAGLDWTVSKRQVQTVDGIVVPDRFALVRDDRNHPFEIVSDLYHVYQNVQLFEFLDSVIDGKARYHTAGALKDGRIVWALIKLTDDLHVKRLDGTDDVLEKHLMFSAGHGNVAAVLAYTNVRPVCWNTWSAVARQKNALRFSHFSTMNEKIEAARAAITGEADVFEQSREVYQKLAETPLRSTDWTKFAEKLLLDGKDKESLGKFQAKHLDDAVEELTALYRHGRGNTGESKWDAWNAVTEYVDHKRTAVGPKALTEGEVTSRRLFSAWFGDGAKLKERAFALLTPK